MESPAIELPTEDGAPGEPRPDAAALFANDVRDALASVGDDLETEPKADDHCEPGPTARADGDAEIPPRDGGSEPDPMSLCRICMSPAVSTGVFDGDDSFRISEKVMFCANVQICESDGLPDRICGTCADDLEVAYNFKTRCERSDAILREKLGLKTKTIVKTEFVLIDCDDDLADRASRRSRAKKRIGDDFIEEEDITVEETDDPSYESVRPAKRRKTKRKKIKAAKSESEDYDDEDDMPLDNVPIKKRKSYPCPDCDKTFPYPSSLKAHAFIHTKKKENRCTMCSEAFVYTKELYAHYKIAHPDGAKKRSSADSPKSYPCSVCDKVFGEAKNLKVHEAMHTREKKYTCDGCSLGFTNMTVLNTHKKREHPELCRPYSCNMCNRSFKHVTALERHIDCHKMSDTNKGGGEKKPPLVKDLFKSIAPLTTTYWSDSFSD